MPLSRFRTALAVAGTLHVGFIFTSWSSPREGTTSGIARSAPELQIELEPPVSGEFAEATEPAPNDAPEGMTTFANRRNSGLANPQSLARAAASVTANRSPAELEASSDASSSADAIIAANETSSPNASTGHPREPKIDLGLDGRLFIPGPVDPGAKAPVRRRNATELTQQLDRSLAPTDAVERGRAHGNVLIASLNSAVRQAGPPAGGNAIIRVSFNASGELSAIELLGGASNDWAAALQAFRAQTRGRRLQLPSGAQGLRVTYNVSSKLQLPSGAAIDSGPIRLKSPSFAPNGLTLRGGFDLAELSQKTSRMVSARIVSEEVL